MQIIHLSYFSQVGEEFYDLELCAGGWRDIYEIFKAGSLINYISKASVII